MPDSYDLLAKSIERVIRSDLGPPASEEQLAGYIDRIMIDEARAGALRLAWLRVLLVVPIVGMTFFALATRANGGPRGPVLAAAIASLAWLAIAVALVLVLRAGWYRRWLPHMTPVIDALAIAGTFLAPPLLDAAGRPVADVAALAALVALCGFLSVSGALRVSRTSSRTEAALAVLVFLVAAIVVRLAPLVTLVIAAALVGTGLLSASITVLVRRLVTDEVAKATLTRMYQDATLTIDAREQVLKVVAHELRNPLNTVFMCTDLLLEEPLSDEQRTKQLRRVKAAGKSMNRLAQDLLDVAKLEAGRVAISARQLEVGPFLRDAHESLAPLAAEKSISLDLDIAEALPHVTADAGRIQQVLSNLVVNAIKFTPKEGRIVIRATPSPGGVRFSVSDTGPGIPADQLERVFARFWQADASDRRGIGLGLTIAKGIMDAHGGRIWVESRPGEGTTFHFVLGSVLPSTSSVRERRGESMQAGARS